MDGRGDGDSSNKDACDMVERFDICGGEEGGRGSGSDD